jgi:hypothetical protein
LLAEIGTIADDTINNQKDGFTVQLKQFAEVVTIVVIGCRLIHSVDIVDVAPHDKNDNCAENDDGSQMIFCILHNVCFTHNFIVLFSLFIESVVIFIEYRCAKVGLISQSSKQNR